VRVFILPVTMLLAAGCVSSNQKPLGGDAFGAATAENKAAMVVDPTPAEGAPEGNGAAVDLAVKRYKTDTVKKPSTGRAGSTAATGPAPTPPPQ
jgi:hypothetical protein